MRRTLLLLFALAAVVGLAVGSGGFSAAEADRGVTVDVVGDENAYLALNYSAETAERSAAVGENVTLPVATVTNQFAETVIVSLDYTVSGPAGLATDGGGESATLAPGSDLAVATEARCESAGEYTVSVAFDASATGDGVSAETTDSRTVTYGVDCEAQA